MESSTPPEQKPVAPPTDPEDRVVRRGDLRGLRRWLIVTSIWAIAATAIGVVAFLEARDAKESSTSRATQGDIDKVSDRLTKDIDELGSQVDGLPTQSEVSSLQTRVRKAQRDATKATNDASDATDDVSNLRGRVSDLEDQVDALETEVDSNNASDSN